MEVLLCQSIRQAENKIAAGLRGAAALDEPNVEIAGGGGRRMMQPAAS
jgi:hypothetical protein